jgi:hypothetical protein
MPESGAIEIAAMSGSVPLSWSGSLFFAIEKLLFCSMLPSGSKLDNGERNAALFFIVAQTPVLQNTETPRLVDGCANYAVARSFHCSTVPVDLGQFWQAAYNKRLCACSQTHSNHVAGVGGICCQRFAPSSSHSPARQEIAPQKKSVCAKTQ